jgi:hypothetical protein
MPLIPLPRLSFVLDPCANRAKGTAGQVVRMSRLGEGEKKFNLMKLGVVGSFE